jgi:hypothetical protein
MTDEFSAADRKVLRDLAKRVAEVAALPVMAERRRLWKKFNALLPERAMILVFPEGSWREIKADWQPQCEGQEARAAEDGLRTTLWTHEHMDTDVPAEPEFWIGKAITDTGWGLQPQWIYSREETGARKFDPVLHSAADLKKLHFPEVSHDAAASAKNLEFFTELFGDILSVHQAGIKFVGFHLIQQYTFLRGLEQAMVDMYECPELIHEAMRFFQEGNRRLVQQYLDQGLLDLNNDGTYNNSGGVSYSDELPQKDFAGKVRFKDLWACAETQEFALVSPQMHEEFALQYEKPLLEPFGLTGYGCCEDLTNKLDYVFKIPHLRRISISPFADVDRCAAGLKGDYVFSWKAHPAHMVGQFKSDMIRQYIRHTLEVCRDNGCVLEMILKDTHSCAGHPERFTQWTKIARELVNEFAGK